MEKTQVTFKTVLPIAKLIEKEAEKKGYRSKADFLTMLIADSLFGFEAVRHKDTISDMLDIFEPRLNSLIHDKELAAALINELKALQRVYIQQRLLPHLKLQKHLTDQAVQSYLQGDDIVEQTGIDGFVINNCLAAIYDKLCSSGIISVEEWEDHTQHYSMYLQHGEGAAQLLNQQE